MATERSLVQLATKIGRVLDRPYECCDELREELMAELWLLRRELELDDCELDFLRSETLHHLICFGGHEARDFALELDDRRACDGLLPETPPRVA